MPRRARRLVQRAYRREDPAVDPDADRGGRRIPADPVRAVGPAREVLRPVLRVQLMALRLAAEPVSVRHLVRAESRDVRSARIRRDVAVSRRERPVRPEARLKDAAVLQAQSKVHRPAAALRSMVLREARRELVLRLEAEPRVQAVAAAPSEQPLVTVAPSEQQPGVAEAEPSVLALKVAQHEARLAAVAELDVPPVAEAVQDAQPEVQPLAQPAAVARGARLAVEAEPDVRQVEEAVRGARPEARVVQPSAGRPWAAPSRLVLRLARRQMMTLRHTPALAKVERPRSQSSSAGSVGYFSW